MSTQPTNIPGRQQTPCTKHNATTQPPIRRACATHPDALYYVVWLIVFIGACGPVIHHLPLIAAALRETDLPTLWTGM